MAFVRIRYYVSTKSDMTRCLSCVNTNAFKLYYYYYYYYYYHHHHHHHHYYYLDELENCLLLTGLLQYRDEIMYTRNMEQQIHIKVNEKLLYS